MNDCGSLWWLCGPAFNLLTPGFWLGTLMIWAGGYWIGYRHGKSAGNPKLPVDKS